MFLHIMHASSIIMTIIIILRIGQFTIPVFCVSKILNQLQKKKKKKKLSQILTINYKYFNLD